MIQFNFQNEWHRIIEHYFFDSKLQRALEEGLKECILFLNERNSETLSTEAKDLETNFQLKKNELGWLQSWPSGHFLSLFVLGLACRMYPKLEWKIIENDAHSVVAGFENRLPFIRKVDFDQNSDTYEMLGLRMVMDITMFDVQSAEESFDSAYLTDDEFCAKYGDEDE